jgi:hypothetical protein
MQEEQWHMMPQCVSSLTSSIPAGDIMRHRLQSKKKPLSEGENPTKNGLQ